MYTLGDTTRRSGLNPHRMGINQAAFCDVVCVIQKSHRLQLWFGACLNCLCLEPTCCVSTDLGVAGSILLEVTPKQMDHV